MRKILAVLALLILAVGTLAPQDGVIFIRHRAAAPPAGTVLGYDTLGASDDYWTANYLVCNAYTTNGTGGTVSKIQAAVWAADSTHYMKFAIYTENGTGAPETLVANSGSGPVLVTRTSKPTQDSEWTNSTVHTATLAANTVYHICHCSKVQLTFAYTVTGNAMRYNAGQDYATWPPASYAGSSSINEQASMYLKE